MYEILTDMNVLYEAFRLSKKGVGWKNSIQKYESRLFLELLKLRTALIDETYEQKPFFEFDLYERGKTRHIKSLHISDRVLQRALCDNILIPLLYKYLIYDNGASVSGKGIDFTRNRLTTHLQKYYRKHGNDGYILLVDFSKFFDSIPHDKLMNEVERHIDDVKIIKLIRDMVNTFGDDKSLGIGSQISQIFGIYYPTKLDNYIKIVKSCKYYGRYMDDFYVIDSDKKFLQELLIDIKNIAKELGLQINDKKTQICRIDKGFIFLKLFYFMTDTGKIARKPCKKNIVRERRKLKKFRQKVTNGEMPFKDVEESYKSWRGNILKYNSYYSVKNMDKLFNELFSEEINAERKGIKSKRST